MTMVSDSALRDVKASIAKEIADAMPKGERLHAVCQTLRIEQDEARVLIARGRRLAREKSTIIGDAAA